MLLWRRKGGQHTVFPWSECLSHTQDLSLSLLASALALTPECCVTFTGADDVFYDTFLPACVPPPWPAIAHSPHLQQHLYACHWLFFCIFLMFISLVMIFSLIWQLFPHLHPQRGQRSAADAWPFRAGLPQGRMRKDKPVWPHLHSQWAKHAVLHLLVDRASSLSVVSRHFLYPNSTHTLFLVCLTHQSHSNNLKGVVLATRREMERPTTFQGFFFKFKMDES